MQNVMGVAWFEDEAAYGRALEIFIDPENMPASFEAWQALVGKQCALIKSSGTRPLRADIDPETFLAWCADRGFPPNAAGRMGFVNHVVLEYQKTGEGTFIE